MEKSQPPPYSTTQPGFQSPPPHGGYPDLNQMNQQPSAPVQHTVIVTQAAPLVFGPQPANITCPSCHAQILTTVKSEATTKTHLFALLLCLFGCYCCCCIPYCVDSCQSQQHLCPNCHAYLGAYNN